MTAVPCATIRQERFDGNFPAHGSGSAASWRGWRWIVGSLLAMSLSLSALPASANTVWDDKSMRLCSKTQIASKTQSTSSVYANHRLYYTESRSIYFARYWQFINTAPKIRVNSSYDYPTYGASAYGNLAAFWVERDCI